MYTKQDLTTRRADLSDKADCNCLITLLEAYKKDPMGGSAPYSEMEKQRLIGGLSSLPSCLVLFCFAGKKFAGGAVCFRSFATFTAKPCINIHDLYVLSGFRRTGAGSALLEAIEQEAKDSGAARITLEVRRDNRPARKLYTSRGFRGLMPPMLFWAKYI